MGDADKLPDGNLPIVTRTINGTDYAVTRLGFWDVQTVIADLNDILGPSLKSALDSGSFDVGAMLDSNVQLGEAVTGALRRAVADGEKGRDLQERFGLQTMLKTGGKRVFLDHASMDVWFSQHPDDWLDWLWFCLDVQVMSFFGRLRPVLSSALGFAKAAASEMQARATAAESRSPST